MNDLSNKFFELFNKLNWEKISMIFRMFEFTYGFPGETHLRIPSEKEIKNNVETLIYRCIEAYDGGQESFEVTSGRFKVGYEKNGRVYIEFIPFRETGFFK